MDPWAQSLTPYRSDLSATATSFYSSLQRLFLLQQFYVSLLHFSHIISLSFFFNLSKSLIDLAGKGRTVSYSNFCLNFFHFAGVSSSAANFILLYTANQNCKFFFFPRRQNRIEVSEQVSYLLYLGS